jgi:subtilisin family serine protease
MKPLGALLATFALPLAVLPTSPVAALDHAAPTQSADAAQSSILPVNGQSLSMRGDSGAEEPQGSNLWRAIRMPGVPDGVDGSGILVAVVDSGVEALVPNLRGQVLPGKDFNKNPTKRGWHDPVMFGGHGTGVASIIVGKGRGTGVRGVAPGARVLPVRVANSHGTSPDARIARAIRWAVAQDVDVINLSMGDDKSNDELNAAIRYAVRKGVIFVAGAGNDGPDNAGPFYPAAIPDAIAVGGTGRNQSRVAGFSCRGDWVDLVAPGTWVPQTSNDGSKGVANGTSFASPFVAGVAALMLQANPNLKQEQVRRILTSTAIDIAVPGFDIEAGHGRLNAAAAVKKARDLYRRHNR